MALKVAQIGNFEPDHSTENELRRALEYNKVDVVAFQENQPGVFLDVANRVDEFDFVLWTRTGWEPPVPNAEMNKMLKLARKASVPTVGYHLDRWWGLNREPELTQHPFFKVDLLCTADGGHQEQWAALGIDHVWFPPGIGLRETQRKGVQTKKYESDLAFVGSWLPGYHVEAWHRPALISWLRENYSESVKFWPPQGEHAVRGKPLADLYASVKIIVGDSCLVPGDTRYISDRVPETIGRGGFLLHPWVEGLDQLYENGKHIVYWPMGDWDALRQKIEFFLKHPDEAKLIASTGREHVIAHHTYEVRMQELVVLLTERGML